MWQRAGPQVGKYHVNLADLEAVGAKAIAEATENCLVAVVDEIGPMELFSQKFKAAVKSALESDKVVLGVVHAKAKDPLITEAKRREDTEVFLVTPANRDGLAEVLAQKILSQLGNSFSPLR
jgi:nucleoside-triphosphatase